MFFTVNPATLLLVWIFLVISYLIVALRIDQPSGIFVRNQGRGPSSRRGDGYALFSFVGASLVILGAKLSLIHYYGSDLPFWDQWDAEPQALYIPYDQGKLLWSDLFRTHNEHRIFFSRLWALTSYAINQQWDAGVQTVANAFLHTFVGLWLAWLLWKLNHKSDLWIILGVGIIILSVPFSWENTLWGFQSSFYFLLGFSSLAIMLIPQSKPFSMSWIMGILFASLSLFTMGSGFFAAIVSFALILIRMYRGRQATWSDGISLIFCALIFLAGVFLMHVPEGHIVLRPKTLSDFMTALGKNLSWPWIDVPFLFPILWSPFVVLSYRICIGRKEPLSRYAFFVMGLGLWTLVQCIALAYARGFDGSGPASRYMDSLSLIPAVNILSAHELCRRSKVNFLRRKGVLAAVSIWHAFAVIGFVNLLINGSIEGFSGVGASLSRQSATVSHYLASEDEEVILKARYMEIPYPDAKKLSLLLKDQAIRERLPASVRKPLALDPSVNDRNDFIEDGFFDTMPALRDRKVWGSYKTLEGDRHRGYFKSERIAAPRLPYLRFRIAGYLDNSQMKLELYGMDHRLIGAVAPKRLPKESWRSIDIPSPQVDFYIKATDQTQAPGGWFAFSEPTEIGYLSVISESIRSSGRAMLVMGLAFLFALVVYAHLQIKNGVSGTMFCYRG